MLPPKAVFGPEKLFNYTLFAAGCNNTLAPSELQQQPTNQPPPTLKPSLPHGSPIVVFYRKMIKKNRFSDADRQKPISDS